MTPEPPPVQGRILVADDSAHSRQLLARILREFTRADVVEARTGSDAWSEYQRTTPNLTFLDIDMPGRSGIELLADIRRADPKAFVVMVSGLSATAIVREAITLGAGGFVVKPYAPNRILGVLQKYVAEAGDPGLMRDAPGLEPDFWRHPVKS